MTGRADIIDSIHGGGVGGTYGGNPLACAAALAVIEIFESENLLGRAQAIEVLLKQRLAWIAQTSGGVIGDIRGRGAMIAIELVKPGTQEPNVELLGKVVRYCHERGVLVITAGSYGNVLRFLPPLSISDELLNEAMDVLAEAFTASI